MSAKWRNIILLSIVVLSSLMHSEHLSKDLMSIHVWRQTQTQSTAISFYEEDMNIFNPRRSDRGDGDGLFRMEFPLLQWLTACLLKVFGNHLIVARLFIFLIGLLSVFGMYTLLKVLFGKEAIAVIGAWAFNSSPSFYYYTINPLPDNLALCASIWGLAFFFKWMRNERMAYLICSGLFLSIGALCKLPFIIYFIVPGVYFLKTLIKAGISQRCLIQITAALAWVFLPLVWYISVIPTWKGNPIVQGMLHREESLSILFDYLQHTFISTLPELLLNYGSVLFFMAGFYFLIKRKAYKDNRFVLILSLACVTLLYYFFEANAIAKIHDYYLFPFYPLLFILVGYGAYHMYQSGQKAMKYLTIFLLLILPLTCYLRMQTRWNPDSPGFNKDLLIHKSELRSAAPKDALIVAGNDESHFIFFYYLDKKGWGFHNDQLSPEALEDMIEKGAEYLYTDSRSIYENESIAKYLDTEVMSKGSIKVYKLRRTF